MFLVSYTKLTLLKRSVKITQIYVAVQRGLKFFNLEGIFYYSFKNSYIIVKFRSIIFVNFLVKIFHFLQLKFLSCPHPPSKEPRISPCFHGSVTKAFSVYTSLVHPKKILVRSMIFRFLVIILSHLES